MRGIQVACGICIQVACGICGQHASTRFEEQRQLHLPQKHKATVPESSLRVEMNALEEQADNAKARNLIGSPFHG